MLVLSNFPFIPNFPFMPMEKKNARVIPYGEEECSCTAGYSIFKTAPANPFREDLPTSGSVRRVFGSHGAQGFFWPQRNDGAVYRVLSKKIRENFD